MAHEELYSAAAKHLPKKPHPELLL